MTAMAEPNFSMRYNKTTPVDLLRLAARLIRTGCGMPSMFNDEVAVKGLVDLGIPHEDALDYCPIGCVETGVPGMYGHRATGMTYVNWGKVLEIVLNHGNDPKTDIKLIDLGDKEYASYDEVWAAWEKALKYYSDLAVESDAICDRALVTYDADPFASCFIDNCMALGKTLKEGGCKYDVISQSNIGPCIVGNSLAVVKKLVFEDKTLSNRPLTDFWRVGRGYAKKLEHAGLMTMGDIARCSVGRASDYYNEDLLYRMFGVNAELLIDHAWGWEPCEIADIRSYEPGAHSISSGQVLTGPADYATARLITKEMADALALDLVDKSVLTNRLTLAVGYDIGSLDSSKLDSCADYAMKRAAERAAKSYQGPVTIDRFGRKVPKSAVGSIGLGDFTSSSARIREAMTMLYERIVDSRLLVRRLTVIADDVATPEELAAGKRYEQLDLFGDDGAQSYGSDSTSEKDGEHDIQRALLDVKRKFGRNAVIKAMDMEDGATGQDRNRQIGGHRA